MLFASAAGANEPTTPLLDEFNRADEDPIGSSNIAWAQADDIWEPGQLDDSHFAPREAEETSVSYWTAESFSGDMEVWANPGEQPDFAEQGWRLGFLKDVGGSSQVDGYLARVYDPLGENENAWVIEKYANGAVSVIASEFDVGSFNNLQIVFRRVGNQLQLWALPGCELRRPRRTGASTVLQSCSWVQRVAVTDSTYTEDLHLALGLDSMNTSSPQPYWDNFGGGETEAAPSTPPPSAQSNGTFCDRGSLARTGTCIVADPVNTRTGWFVTQLDDLSLTGTGVAVNWTRSYTSGDATVGPFGPGWTHPYAASLDIAGNGDVTARGEEGQELFFEKQTDGSYVGAAGALASLSLSAGVYSLVRTDQVTYTFNSQGVLTSVKDRNDQGLTFAYTSGKLTTITDAAGRDVTVAYNGSDLVSEVELEDERSVSYGYTSGRLTSVTDVRGETWTYTYDSGGRLATIVDPLSHTQVTNVYGTDGRITSQTDATSKTTTFDWDEGTETATVTDPNDNEWQDVYENGVLVQRIDPLDNATEFGRDADLNETSVESPTGEQTTMTYDENANLLTATAPASMGSVEKTFEYNARNDPTEVTDARGKVTEYTYDADGNLETATLDGDEVAAYTYDTAGRVETATDGNGKTTTYDYDADGNLISVLQPDPDGAGSLEAPETTYTYDDRGFMETRVDPIGNLSGGTPSQHTTSFTYNDAGQLLTETNQLGDVVTTNVYDDAGRLTSKTDANGHTTSYTYDSANRLLTETGPDPDGGGSQTAPVATYTYDDAGNKLTETDPRGNTTTFAYDDANRLISETAPDPDGGGSLTAPVTTYTYDDDGNLASTVEPRGNLSGADPDDFRTEYTYDAAGRLLTTTDPLGNLTTNDYDDVGNLASVEDANEHTTSYSYDAAGRILTVTAPDPDGGGSLSAPVTTYTYDDAGNLLTRTDANSHATTSAYDGSSRLVSETGSDPDGGGSQTAPVTTYAYDANGNRTLVTDPNGNATGTSGDGQTTYGYDRANQLTSIDYSDTTPDVAYTYDDVGNRTQMTDGPGTETRTYDNLDRLLTGTRGSFSFSYEYDTAGNVTKRTYPDAKVADYTYDPLNRMATVTDGTHTVTYGYDAASNLLTTTLPSANGHVETRTYDEAGRLTGVKSVKGTTTLIDSQYTRDPVGNPTLETTTGTAAVTKTFGYDNMDRLTSVCFQSGTCPGGSDPFIRWTYDGVGNRLTEVRPAGTTNYSYDARDRLTSAGATSYTYDDNGNQLSAGSRTFTWDLANRLKTTSLSPTTTTYTYNGDGLRTQASTGTTNQSKTNYTWDVNHELPQVVREGSGSNAIYRRYFHGVDLQWMSTLENNTNAYYIHYDPLGSVRNITAQGGATQWTYDYEPYGATRTQTGSTPTSLVKFTGEYEDPTGLYHLRARQYDPSIGRLLTTDPLQSPGASIDDPFASMYSYVANRPTTDVDPSGMIAEPLTSSVGGQEAAYRPSSPVEENQVGFVAWNMAFPHFSLTAYAKGKYEYIVRAWWERTILTPRHVTTATLKLKLQWQPSHGGWLNMGREAIGVKPPGRRFKVTAAAKCAPNTVRLIRGSLDVDVNGAADSPGRNNGTPRRVKCAPN